MCEYCDNKQSKDLLTSSFSYYGRDIKTWIENGMLKMFYYGAQYWDVEGRTINYCPMCGDKLEVKPRNSNQYL